MGTSCTRRCVKADLLANGVVSSRGRTARSIGTANRFLTQTSKPSRRSRRVVGVNNVAASLPPRTGASVLWIVCRSLRSRGR